MGVSKKTGFAAPYRSLTFRNFLDSVLNRNGVMSMDSDIYESAGVVYIPPMTFNQRGLIVEIDSVKSINKPSGLTGAYLLIAHSPTTTNVDDIVISFAETPLEVDQDEVVLAEWDGNEWRQLPFISNDAIIKGIEKDHLDFLWEGPVNGLITSVDGLSYRNTAGIVIDREGRKTDIDSDVLISSIDADPEATFGRVDRMVFRRQLDNENRVGVRKLLKGGTFSSAAQSTSGPQIADATAYHSRVRVGLYGNEAVVLLTKGYGAEFSLWIARTADDKTTLSQAATQIAGVTSTTDEVDMSVDAQTGEAQVVYVQDGNIYTVRVDANANILSGPTLLVDISQPCSNPRITVDRSGKYLITFLALMGPSNSQVWFCSCNDLSQLITGAKQVTSTVTNIINQDMWVTDDYELFVVYEDNTQGKIYYDILDDIGTVQTVAPAYISQNIVSTSNGTNSDNASLPKVRVTDTKTVFFFFLQTQAGAQKLCIVKNDEQGYSPNIVSPSEDFTGYDVQASDLLNDIYLYAWDASNTYVVVLDGESSISQSSIVFQPVTTSPGNQSGAIIQDETGSLFQARAEVAPGTYSDTGSPVAVQDIGPAALVGTQGSINLAANQIGFLTASFSPLPKVGQRITVAGAADSLNNVSKIITNVEEKDYNATADYTVVTVDSSYNSSESPAASATAQLADPDGMIVDCEKCTAEESESRALRFDVPECDTLLARIVMPGQTILNYVLNPVFGGGTTALAQQFGVYGSSQIDWQASTPNAFTIGSSFGIVDMFTNLDYAIQAGTFPMAEGDAIYVKLDGSNFTVTPQVTPIALLPWSDPIQVLGYIRGGEFNPVLLVFGGGAQLDNGEIIVIGQDLPTPIRSRLGITGETTYQAYTSTIGIGVSNTYPEALSNLDLMAGQNRNVKLVRGGTWSFDAAGVLAWDADAYVQVTNLVETRNRIPAGNVSLTADGQVAYVNLNREAGANADLPITVVSIDTLVPTRNTLIIARRIGSDVLVADHMTLAQGESQLLSQSLSTQTQSALGLTSETDEGQLRIMAIAGSKRIRITPTDKLVFDGTKWGNEIASLPMKFDGLQLDLETGNYYGYGDGTIAGSGALVGSAFTPGAFTSPNLYRWYSINLVADTVNADGTMNVKPLVLTGTDGSSSALAVKAPYSSKKLGQVLVQAPGSGSSINTTLQSNVTQLTGGTGGGGGASAKLIGGGTLSNTVTETPLANVSQLVNNSFAVLSNTANDFVGQSFTVASNKSLKQITVQLLAPGTIPNGSVRAELHELTSLSPSGTFGNKCIAVSTALDVSTLTASFANYSFTFPNPPFLKSTKFYAIIIKNVSSDQTIQVGTDAADVVAGNLLTGSTTGTVSITGTADMYFDMAFSTFSCVFKHESELYVEQPRLDYVDNTIVPVVGGFTLPTPDHVVYIDRLNASSGGPALTVAVDLITNVKDGQMIVARRGGNEIIVGTSSTRLSSGESKTLYAGVSDQLLSAIGASNNADKSGQGRILARASSALIDISSINKTAQDGTQWSKVNSSLSTRFNGAVVNFNTGVIYEADGVTALGTNFTPDHTVANLYRWYSLTAIPSTVNAINEFKMVILALPAASGNAVAASAPLAPYGDGIRLGQVLVRTNSAASGADNISQSAVLQALDGGSGGGTGDAFEIVERAKENFQDSSFEFMTPVEFAQIKETLTSLGSTTGSYSIVNKTYALDSGQKWTSANMLDAEFYSQARDLLKVELLAFWSLSYLDPAATYKVSRNNGNTWQTVTMEQVGSSDVFRGLIEFAEESPYQTASSNTTGSTSLVELGPAATKRIAQPFTLTDSWVLQALNGLKITKTGSPTGYFWVEILADNAGVPDVTPLASSVFTDISTLTAGVNTLNLSFTAILPAGNYWIALRTSDQYASVFSTGVTSISAELRTGSGATDADGYNGTTWSPITGKALLYTYTGRQETLQVEITSSTNGRQLAGIAILYGSDVPSFASVKPIQKFTFSGDLNTYSFALTRFKPNAELLRVYDVSTGKVYRYGAFSISGTTVIFDSGQFYDPGKTIQLIFDQADGGSFDNSDDNANLLSENRLGSRDATLDRSISGEGILLRADNGNLVEAWIKWNGTSYEWALSEVN